MSHFLYETPIDYNDASIGVNSCLLQPKKIPNGTAVDYFWTRVFPAPRAARATSGRIAIQMGHISLSVYGVSALRCNRVKAYVCALRCMGRVTCRSPHSISSELCDRWRRVPEAGNGNHRGTFRGESNAQYQPTLMLFTVLPSARCRYSDDCDRLSSGF